MRSLYVLCTLAVLIAPLSASAQQPAANRRSPFDQDMSLGQVAPTPDMWFYDQAMKMYRDPKVAVRRRAEFDADQRKYRLAAQRWFGFSNSRPTVSPTPYTGSYSPCWVSNSAFPFQWSGVNHHVVVVPQTAARGYGLW